MEDIGAIADRYLRFAKVEAAVSSPVYAALALAVAQDAVVLGFLATLPRVKQQPNLLLAVLRLLGGVPSDGEDLRARIEADPDRIRGEMLARATQTNEVARASALLPALSLVEGPLALVEVGCSAGLLLHLDRYGYRYATEDGGVHRLGRQDGLVLECAVTGPAPLLTVMPQVVARIGIDRNPLDPTDPDAAAWLRALIWPGPQHDARVARLDAALTAVGDHERVTGDLVDELPGVLARLPASATPVVVSSQTLVYLDDAARGRFRETVAGVHHLAAESPGVVVEGPSEARDRVVVSLDGRPLALAAPHGGALTWL